MKTLQKEHLIKRLWLGLLLYIFTFFTSLNAQELQFNNLTVTEGLTQHDVSCIIQDSFGFIWIGTYDGLNRYDGFKTLNFSNKTGDIESLSSNRIICLFEDSKKRIWIGTDGNGLNYYSLETEKFVRIKTPLGFNLINDISENDKGEIYIATGNGLLKIIDSDKQPKAEIVQLPLTGLSVNKILISKDKSFYFATNRGVWVWKDNICSQLKKIDSEQFSDLIEDNNQNIWAGGYQRLNIIKRENNKVTVDQLDAFSEKTISSICKSKDGTVWIGTLNSGVFKMNVSSYEIEKNYISSFYKERSLLSNTVLSLFLDNTNTLWVGNRQGLCYTNLSQKKISSIPLEKSTKLLQNTNISTLMIDDNNLYYGIQNNGCFQYSFKNNETYKIYTEVNFDPLFMTKIKESVFVGSNRGLFLKDKKNINFRQDKLITNHNPVFPLSVSSIIEDGNGTQYFGSFSGLIIRNGDNTDWIHYLYPQTEVLRNKRIFSLLYDKDASCIWIGTISDGLYKLNLTSEGNFISLEVYSESMQNSYHITNNTIWCFLKSKNGTLWIGTDAGLLKKSIDSNKIIQISTEGIVDRKIMGIIEDKQGNLWLTNSQGLIRFDIDTNSVHRYTYKDGLLSSTFTEAVGKDKNGKLFFGNIKGINYFNPLEITDNPYKTNVAISDFKIHNISISAGKNYFGQQVLQKSINLTKTLTLNYKQNNFLFEFSGTNYANASENLFKYKLDGYDTEWIHVVGNQKFATYSNLEQGNYTFYVEAANNDGVWSGNPKKIIIKILPAPWFSIWAYLCYIALILGIILSFIFFLSNRQKLKHQIELENIQHNKDQEINELKLTFFTDVAHEFKTPLSLIIGPLNDLMESTLSKDRRDFCFQIVQRNTKRMMFLVTQLLDFRKVNANLNILNVSLNNLADFTKETTKAFLWQAKREEINLNIITPDAFECYFDMDVVEKVLYNLLSNAFKFTPKNGIIEIEIKPIWKKNRKIANIIIRDSGKGISDKEKMKIFERFVHGKDRSSSGIGLHLTYQLIRAHKGDINVTDSNYGGSEFIVTIPVSEKDYQENEFSKETKEISSFHDISIEFDKPKKEISEKRERVLIIEDDHDLRAYLKNSLKSHYTILESSNGLEGIEKSVKYLPDIIISDVMMPEMDGIEMCKELKKNIKTSHIPLLLLTAKTAEEHVKIGLEAGAWDYITKPFNTQSLHQKILNILNTRNKFREFLITQNITIQVKDQYSPYDQKLISKISKIIEDNMSNPNFSTKDFATEIGLSRMQLHRKLKGLLGQTTTSFVNKIKMQYAAKMFDEGCDRIQEAMDAVGINSYTHFNNTFKKYNGKTATKYIADKKLKSTI
ncbi:response regulator [Polaribacter litorisediminis]|uniref:hybrid sensor histidine kinase/response regulator transcription factor n=1 Tax=Polaribacter litorisediminis TaxID=1908341 RepID=UPI001CBCF1CC|nr:two-component regulator propeller domain-containing protein [Polaribacter litorisediminis]UAM97144.1 response regulator [Polaribacter litorisediminis]